MVLSTSNELALMDLYNKSVQAGIKCVLFKEPDIGNESTAIAMEPHELTYRLTSSIPLALKHTEESRKAMGG